MFEKQDSGEREHAQAHAHRTPIKVLIVEDSPVAQEFLTYLFSSDPDIEVVGVADNGREALKAVERKKPDVITMDIHMPVMDGFEATRRIMSTHPTPIVIVSGSAGITEVKSTFKAIEAGALAVVRRPPGIDHEAFKSASIELLQTVKLMSEIKVVRRFSTTAKTPDFATHHISRKISGPAAKKQNIQVAAVGASTGGPAILLRILSRLPANLSFPIVIVQHISPGFASGFIDWLAAESHFPVRIGMHGARLLPGQAYVAPDGYHMGVSNDHRILLSDCAPENGLRPAVSYLFRSVAQAYGPRAAGILLTGMGRDGASELKILKDSGAVTIAQDEDSCVVYGMPGEAIKLGAALHILAPDDIATLLSDLNLMTQGGLP